MPELQPRAAVPLEETWDLGALYASPEAWEADLPAADAAVAAVARFRGRLAEGAAVLRACLLAYEAALVVLRRLGAYASLRMAEDAADPGRQSAAGRLAARAAGWAAEMAVVESEILDLPPARLAAWIEAEPGLAPFRGTLQRIERGRPHRLGAETEAALEALGEVLHAPATVYGRAMASDVRYAPFRDAQGVEQANSYLVYEDRFERAAEAETRRRSYASFVAGLRGYRHTFAATLAAEVRRHVALARLRRHPSAQAMLLHGQEVSAEAYERQLDVLQAEVAPHLRRLARLRRRVLGLQRLLYCDLEAPLDPGFEPQVSYAEVGEQILRAVSVLGDDYRGVVQRALGERWVDRAANAGKGNSRFCAAVYGAHPYVCTGWTGTMRSAFILAHELGHAAHAVLYMQSQRAIDCVLPPHNLVNFVEAPSTGNEVLLWAHLSRGAEPRFRRWATLQLLATYHHNFVRHLLEGELQRRMYARAEAGGAITADWLDAEQLSILAGYWGDTLELDDGAACTWMRQPHYYSGLYSYTYSVGLTVATAVMPAIAAGDVGLRERWLDALRAGPTLPAPELARLAGVDLDTPEPLHRAAAFVGGLIDELEASWA